jgi:hypothetical protein
MVAGTTLPAASVEVRRSWFINPTISEYCPQVSFKSVDMLDTVIPAYELPLTPFILSKRRFAASFAREGLEPVMHVITCSLFATLVIHVGPSVTIRLKSSKS